MPHIPYRMRPSHKSTYGNHEEAQIHASITGCDSGSRMRDPENNTLKSTHPLRDATPVCPGRVTTEVAKIHASRAGCDIY